MIVIHVRLRLMRTRRKKFTRFTSKSPKQLNHSDENYSLLRGTDLMLDVNELAEDV